MKKIISILSVFAAGTFTVNAASVVFYSGAISGNFPENFKALNQSGVTSASYSLGDEFGSAKLGWSIDMGKLFSGTGYLPEAWSNESTKTGFSAVTGVSGTQLDTLITGVYGVGAGTATTTLKFENLDANTSYRFSFIFKSMDADQTGTLKLVDGKGTLDANEKSYAGSLEGTDAWEEINSASVTTNPPTWMAASFVVTTNGSGEAYFSADHKTNFSGIVISTIPEPSAFGLLAGIGALALVVSRRRRSIKRA